MLSTARFPSTPAGVLRLTTVLLLGGGSISVAADGAKTLLPPWLEVPSSWVGSLQEDGVVAVSPDDLPAGAALVMLVEPPAASVETVDEAFANALVDLGPWRSTAEPVDQRLENGWVFRMGVGAATLGGQEFTALTAVGLQGGRRARFWVLADSDATFNRYQEAVGRAISSVQDSAGSSWVAPSVPPPATIAPPTLDRSFGEGISGVYLGIERGARASAGAAGQQLVLDLATNFLGVGGAPGSPQTVVSLQDFPEVDLFLPDGSYRRGLPIRGLGSDLAWDRAHQPIFWGAWQRDGNRITVRRGSYTTSYLVAGDRLVSERDRPWRKLALPANVRLNAAFARADFRDPGAPRLVLRADGTYEDRGGFLRMVGSAWHLVVPDGDRGVEIWTDAETDRFLGGGAGTYTFDAFSLTLTGSDGRIWQINAYLPPSEETARGRLLVVNTYLLVAD